MFDVKQQQIEKNIRNIRQQEATDSFEKRGIFNCCPRFGKIKAAIKVMKREGAQKILICYPRVDIKEGWLKDFVQWDFLGRDVEFSTFIGMGSEPGNNYKNWDFLIIDEIHEASSNQLQEINRVSKNIPFVLGLSGTMTNKTKREVFNKTGLEVCYSYSIEKGVEEGILCDYKLIIHQVDLDNKIPLYEDKTEKKKFSNYQFVVNKLKNENKPYFFLELKMIGFIQNSIAKLKKTKELLKEFEHKRVLVFCGTTNIADKLEIPVYHSKKKEEELFKDFCLGKGKHLATIKMAQAGITVLPIDRGLINYTSGNPEDTAQKICRFLGLEYSTPDKKAEIHIIITSEPFERERMETGLMFFDSEKIQWPKQLKFI